MWCHPKCQASICAGSADVHRTEECDLALSRHEHPGTLSPWPAQSPSSQNQNPSRARRMSNHIATGSWNIRGEKAMRHERTFTHILSCTAESPIAKTLANINCGSEYLLTPPYNGNSAWKGWGLENKLERLGTSSEGHYKSFNSQQTRIQEVYMVGDQQDTN